MSHPPKERENPATDPSPPTLFTIYNKEEQATSTNPLKVSSTATIDVDQDGEEKIQMMVCCTLSKCRWNWLLDVLIASTTLTTFALVEYGVIPSHRGGFYCADPILNRKFNGNTVSAGLLIGGSICIPFFLMFIIEFISSLMTLQDDSNKPLMKRSIDSLKQTLTWYREFLLGLCVVFFITDAIKVIIGEPRPHFFDSCKPDKGIDCVPGTYIDKYECTNKALTSWRLLDITKSFPSGHASVSIYTSTFLVIFLQRRMSFGQSWLLLPWLQLLSSLWGILCSLTRIIDYQHHWWDVLAGTIIGFLIGICTVKQFCRSFRCPHESQSNGPNSILSSASNSPSKWKDENCENSEGPVQRRLLSSSSSYSNSIIEDRELREVNMS